jgi:tetratricopeptide (TPR) repeat protein
LRGAIEWSYDLLDDQARLLFERFSVFARGASLEQAQAVCGDGDIVDALDQLADQSLLRRVPEFSEPRFLMLQTISEFAAERLEARGERKPTKDRHVQAYLDLAKQAQPYFFGDRRKEWFDRLEIEQDNFRGALDWAIASGDAANAMELAASLWRLWQVRGHIWEGRARMAAVLAVPGAETHPKERLQALEAAGGLAYWQADMGTAQRYYDECLALTRTMNDKKALAHALFNAAFPSIVNRERPEEITRPRALLLEALPLFRELGDQSSTAAALWALGNSYYFQNDLQEALRTLDEARQLAQAAGNRFSLAWALHTTGLVHLKLGDLESARNSFLTAIGLFQQDNDVSGLVLQLDNLSQVIRSDGNPYLATRLASAAKTHQGKTGTTLGQLLSEQEGRTGREGLDEAAGAQAWAEGETLSLEEAIQEAIAAAQKRVAATGS